MAKAKQKAANTGPLSEAESLYQIALGLDRVARAIAFAAVKDATGSEQAFHLNQVGFAPSEIGKMFGLPNNVIGARISNVRKAREKREKKHKQ